MLARSIVMLQSYDDISLLATIAFTGLSPRLLARLHACRVPSASQSLVSWLEARRQIVVYGEHIRAALRKQKLQLQRYSYVLIYQNRVSIGINDHKAGGASGAFVCF